MIFYKYTYSFDQKKELAFDYFRRKEYLIKYFEKDLDGETTIDSKDDSEFIKQGELLIIKNEDDELITEMAISDVEIHPYDLIKMKISFWDMEDKEDDWDEEDEAQFNNFISKLLGSGMTYKIEFQQVGGRLKVIETSEIINVGFFIGTCWKVYGIYHRFKQRRIHEKVAKEVEALR